MVVSFEYSVIRRSTLGNEVFITSGDLFHNLGCCGHLGIVHNMREIQCEENGMGRLSRLGCKGSFLVPAFLELFLLILSFKKVKFKFLNSLCECNVSERQMCPLSLILH